MRIRSLFVAIALGVASVFFVSSAATAVQPDGWQDPVQVANVAARYGPFLATSGESTMAVWVGTDNKARFSVSTNGGASWGAANSFSDPSDNVQLVVVQPLNAGGFAVAYSAIDSGANTVVRITTTNASGTLWTQLVSRPANAPDDLSLAVMTGDKLAVGIRANGYGSLEAQIATSNETHTTLTAFQTISGVSPNVYTPSLFFANGTLSAVWKTGSAGALQLTHSSDFGSSWSTPAAFSMDGATQPDQPLLFACHNQLMLAGSSGAGGAFGYSKIFANNFDLSGSWAPVLNVTSADAITSDRACLADGRILSVWTTSTSALFYSVSTFNQGVWSSTAAQLVPLTVAGEAVVAATPDGGAIVAKAAFTVPGETYGIKFNKTATWGTPALLYSVSGAGYPFPGNLNAVPTTTGAVIAWRVIDGGTGVGMAPISSARMNAPAPPAPTPSPDPALADTGAQAALSTQLGGVALAIGVLASGVLVLGMTSVSRRQGRAVRSRARVRS